MEAKRLTSLYAKPFEDSVKIILNLLWRIKVFSQSLQHFKIQMTASMQKRGQDLRVISGHCAGNGPKGGRHANEIQRGRITL